ncbi:depupylase/deamidase Dop [Haematomicrobium sanguinis]|uniref:depupylase/deamidase Dop n=1 Tax=Haematomicrobium sanguinis TaxID=479106 RepID=UPI000479766E|nr:depupylase/deamidase Dop [Haematomicrobium sanguinis]
MTRSRTPESGEQDSLIHRVIGTETEYGVIAPADAGANHTVLSAQVVTAYARVHPEHHPVGWDYTDEAPLSDARGWEVSREDAHPSQLTDVVPVLDARQVARSAPGSYSGWDEEAIYRENYSEEADSMVMNLVTANGARLYVDHAHPEYSAPETRDPLAALRYDLAGDVAVRQSMAYLAGQPELPDIQLYRNNTDGRVSYGSHENYLVPRAVPFRALAAGLTPFFVTRQVFAGAGRLGIGPKNEPGFQLSQRADFFETEIGLETTIRRPIINTRDEPHSDSEKYRRLHVIIGDANQSHTAGWLKLGTTAAVLSVIEAGAAPDIEVYEPVAALQTVSHDVRFRASLRLIDGRRVSALDIQEMYLDAASRLVDARDSEALRLLEAWGGIVDRLRTDPFGTADTLDWSAKHALMQRYRDQRGLAWDDPTLRLVDLQYADIREDRSIYHKLIAAGRMRTLLDAETIRHAASEPPADTRAYFRGRLISQFPRHVLGASWDSAVVNNPRTRRVQRIDLREPLRGTKALTADLFDRHQDFGAFLEDLLKH